MRVICAARSSEMFSFSCLKCSSFDYSLFRGAGCRCQADRRNNGMSIAGFIISKPDCWTCYISDMQLVVQRLMWRNCTSPLGACIAHSKSSMCTYSHLHLEGSMTWPYFFICTVLMAVHLSSVNGLFLLSFPLDSVQKAVYLDFWWPKYSPSSLKQRKPLLETSHVGGFGWGWKN